MPKKKSKLKTHDSESEEDFTSPANPASELVMYIVVNANLIKNMSKGKVSAQCVHSVCEVIFHLEHNSNIVYHDWKKSGQAILVKKAPEDMMINIISQCRDKTNRLSATGDPFWCARTRDEGRTQVENSALTTLTFCPIPKKYTPKWLADMPLL